MELRLYTFCNFYLSSIQQGIQSAHVVHSLFVKYRQPIVTRPSIQSEILWDWAEQHKTMIVLNGGAHDDIANIYQALVKLSQPERDRLPGLPGVYDLPFEAFHEDSYSLGGIITCTGVVVPECFYDAKKMTDFDAWMWVKDDTTAMFPAGSAEYDFISVMKSCGLAR